MRTFFLTLSRKQFLFSGALIFLLSIGIVSFQGFRRVETAVLPNQVQIDGQTYHLEIADTDKTQREGLGDRDSLCGDCGMLFVFHTPGEYAFWMKGMHFPLDIIWLLDDKVVALRGDIQSDSLEVLNPGVPANRVLEFNPGAGKNLSVGDKLQFTKGE